MIYVDVDIALSVPVNVMPLLDDTDSKTLETGVAYNAAGMDLNWNFVTPAGVITQTAVTPTTAGDYDWSETGDAMYEIEIPASGGASINNNTEGTGYFTGVITGILPFRGPDIIFRPSTINDALIEGGDKLEVDVVEVSGDTTAANNLELDYDGTGYSKANSTVGTVTTLNGHTPQTGDSYTRIGAAGVGLTAVSLASTGLDAIASTATGAVEISKAIWDRVLTGATHNIDNSAGKRLRTLDTAFDVHDGTAQSGSTSTTLVMDTGADGTNDDIYNGDRIVITAGTGAGEHGIIVDYDASTRTATMASDWAVTPDNTSEFTVSPADCAVETWNNNSVTGDGDWSTLSTNVSTLLSRVTSTLFSGITSLAEWLGLMAGSQTGNTAARTELRATGTGSGTYDETTDSLEAVAGAGGGGAPTAEQIADAVLDESLSGHTTAGSLGKAIADIEADTNELQADDIPGAIAGLNDIAATDIVSNGAITTSGGAVSNVTTVATTTTNTDMRGTDDAATEAKQDAAALINTEARLSELDAANLPSDIDQIKTDTTTDIPALIAALNDLGEVDIRTAIGMASADLDAQLSAISNLISGLNDPTAAAIASATWAEVIEGSLTAKGMQRIIMAAVSGKLSGAEGTTISIRDVADAKDRITATVDANGNRTAVTLDVAD